MKAPRLLLVFLAAKAFVLLGHSGPFSIWSLVAYTWQDVAVAVAFGVCETISRRTRILYWPLVVYAAINIPVERALSTPVTLPMIRAAGGPLADSFKVYLTLMNVFLVAIAIAMAAFLPGLLQRTPRYWMACAGVIALAGPIASSRVDTHGMGRNPVVALIESSLPRLSARAAAGDPRTARFDQTASVKAEDLSRFAGIAKGRNVVMISLESTAAQYLSLYGGPYDVMPNLNALATKALVFDNAYAVYPESIKGLFSVLCSVFPAFDSEPAIYEKAPCH